MKSKRIHACLWCGLRSGAVKSAFCRVDAKRLNAPLMPWRKVTHYFQWTKMVEGWCGEGIAAELVAELNRIPPRPRGEMR